MISGRDDLRGGNGTLSKWRARVGDERRGRSDEKMIGERGRWSRASRHIHGRADGDVALMEVPCAVLAYPARLTDRPTRRDDETNEHNGERIETTRDERAERGDDLVTLVTAVWCVSLCTAGYDLPIYTRDGTLVGVSSETETETRNFSLLASLNSTVYAGRETESCAVSPGHAVGVVTLLWLCICLQSSRCFRVCCAALTYCRLSASSRFWRAGTPGGARHLHRTTRRTAW